MVSSSLAFSTPPISFVFSSKLVHDSPTTFLCTPNISRTINGQKKVIRASQSLAEQQPAGEDDDNNTTVGNHSAWTNVQNDYWSGELEIQGQIPSWVNGTYLRIGPGVFHAGGHTVTHLFDGFGTLVRLFFNGGRRLILSHRQIESKAYNAAKKKKNISYRAFADGPKSSNLFEYIGNLTKLISGESLTDNANTTVVRLGDGRVLCQTETTNGSIEVDPETLVTLRKFEFKDDIRGCFVQSAHGIVVDRDLVTVLPDLLSWGYLVVKMEAGSNKRKVIGRVKCRGGRTPGWVHSFPVTRNYVIVPEMALRYSISSILREGESEPLYSFDWCPQSKAFMHVMCKTSGKVFINAYEEEDELGRITDIIVDCSEYNGDTSILHALTMNNLRSFLGRDTLPQTRVGRFTIPLDGSQYGKLETTLDPKEHGHGIEMPNVNPNYVGKKYRYAYACGANRPCNFPNILTKLDLVKKKAKNWHDKDSLSVPSEPFFLTRPGATDEDDGVVISLISQSDGGGYALVLDGTTFEEISRAKFPYGLPYGFHGCWIPKN